MAAKYQCQACNAPFQYKSRLDRHLETHMITGDWLCALCDTLVNRLDALTTHWRKACPEMKQIFEGEELREMSSDALQEAAFRHTLSKLSMKEEHAPSTSGAVDLKPLSLTSCVYCSLNLPSGAVKNHYRVHMRMQSAGERIRNSSAVPFLCDVCGFGFKFKKSLFQHWRLKCSEVLANIPEGTREMSNTQLKDLVGDVVRRAETSIGPPGNFPEEDLEEEANDPKDQKGPGPSRASEKEESPNFTAPVNPPDTTNFKEKWAIGSQTRSFFSCGQCVVKTKFSSYGRKIRHTSLMHPVESEERPVKCELCMTRFKESRVLVSHLRTSCRAMKVEVPDLKKLKRMSMEQLQEVVEEAKGRWTELFGLKKRENLRYIEQFLADLDKKRSSMKKEVVPISYGYGRIDTSDTVHVTCPECKAVFFNPQTLTYHQQTVHSQTRPIPPARPINQLTVTTASLLPYFRFEPAVFYDSEGKEYKLGKHLEKDSELFRHLKVPILFPRSLLDMTKDVFVVELMRKEEISGVPIRGKSLVLLDRQEVLDVVDKDGKLKILFKETPKVFEDWPVLEREC